MKKSIFVILLASFFLLVGCNETEEPKDLVPVAGGTMVLQLENFSYNPLAITGEELPINNLQSVIYRGLFKFNEDLKIVGDLAGELTANIDKNQLKFKLNDGVKWEDGSPITFADILYSFEQYSSTNYNGFWKSYTFNLVGTDKFRMKTAEHISGIEFDATNNVITFNFKKLTISDLEFLTAPMISSKKNSASQLLASGPFRIESATESGLELVRNENYGEQVFLDRISVSTTADKATAGAFYATPADVQNSIFAGRKAYDIGGANYFYLGFNLNSDKLKDSAVRTALASTIKLDEIIKNQLGGYAERPLSVMQEDSWLYKESFTTMSARDVKSTLSAVSLSLELAYADTVFYKLIAEKIAADLTASGVTVQLKPIASDEYIATLYSKGEFELFLASNNFEMNPAKENYRWLTKNDVLNNGYNVIHLNDATSDNLLTEAVSLIDSEQRKNKYNEWQTYFGKQQYIAPLLTLDTILLATPKYQISIENSLTPYYDIQNWWYYAKAK